MDPPHAVSVVGLGPEAMMLAEKRVLYALERFADGLATGKWAGYPNRTCWASLPGWMESQWLEIETREQ